MILPPGRIVSIRIEPTELQPAAVSITRLALVAGEATTDIDVCDDRQLQLVRTTRLGHIDAGCAFRFGNGKGADGLPRPDLLASGTPRLLRIAVAGELGVLVKVYLDVGQGYDSQDMLAIDMPSVVPGAPADGSAELDADSGNQ